MEQSVQLQTPVGILLLQSETAQSAEKYFLN